MSRFEIEELEVMLRDLEEPETFVPDDEMFASEEFKELRAQMKAIMPIRHVWMRKYLDKYKWSKEKREELIQMFEESEEQAAEILGDEYVHFLDTMPDIKQFIESLKGKDEEYLARKKKEAEENIEVDEIIDPNSTNPKDIMKLRKQKVKKQKRIIAGQQ